MKDLGDIDTIKKLRNARQQKKFYGSMGHMQTIKGQVVRKQ